MAARRNRKPAKASSKPQKRGPGKPLRNVKHELFAEALARGESADAAYKTAGYRPHRANASKLRAKAYIQERVGELLAVARAASAVTPERVLSALGEIAFATANAQSIRTSDRVAALRELSKILGMGNETVKVRLGGDAAAPPVKLLDLSKLSDAQLRAYEDILASILGSATA